VNRHNVVVGGVAASSAIVAAALARGDSRVWSYVIVTGVCVLAIVVADRSAHFSPPVLGGLCVGVVAHLAGGLLPGGAPDAAILYDRWLVGGVLKFDQAVHFGTSAAMAVAAYALVRGWFAGERSVPRAGLAVVAALVSVGLGGLNEAFEFIASLSVDGLYVGGIENTGWDLVFDCAGAMTAAIWLSLAVSGVAEVHDVADGDLLALAVEPVDEQMPR
jgi:hypothetical protein